MQKVCHLHLWQFSPYITLPHFVSFTLTLPLCYSINFSKKLYNERKENFLRIWLASAFRFISKKIKKHILRHNWIFRHSCCINSPHCQSSGIIIFMCKCYINISVTLVGHFLDVFFLLFALILSGLYEKPWRNKDWVTEKKAHRKMWVRTWLFWLHVLLSMSLFVAFFVYSVPLPKWRTCWMSPIKIRNITMGGILYDDIMSERSKISKSIAI